MWFNSVLVFAAVWVTIGGFWLVNQAVHGPATAQASVEASPEPSVRPPRSRTGAAIR